MMTDSLYAVASIPVHSVRAAAFIYSDLLMMCMYTELAISPLFERSISYSDRTVDFAWY